MKTNLVLSVLIAVSAMTAVGSSVGAVDVTTDGSRTAFWLRTQGVVEDGRGSDVSGGVSLVGLSWDCWGQVLAALMFFRGGSRNDEGDYAAREADCRGGLCGGD